MRRRATLVTSALVVALLVLPAAAFAHDAPESAQSKWVMVDWMMDAFFMFAGVALVGFIWAWKAGHFHDLEEAARIPLQVQEDDYYTPEWALDEEEWADGHADR